MKPPLPIDQPCPADWNAMTGDDRKRFCAQCNKHVHNLSALTPREVREFSATVNGTECIGYTIRPDGSMITAPRWPRLAKWFQPLRAGIATLLAVLLPSLFSGCARDRQYFRTGGKICVAPDSQPDGKMLLGEPRPTLTKGRIKQVPERD